MPFGHSNRGVYDLATDYRSFGGPGGDSMAIKLRGPLWSVILMWTVIDTENKLVHTRIFGLYEYIYRSV